MSQYLWPSMVNNIKLSDQKYVLHGLTLSVAVTTIVKQLLDSIWSLIERSCEAWDWKNNELVQIWYKDRHRERESAWVQVLLKKHTKIKICWDLLHKSLEILFGCVKQTCSFVLSKNNHIHPSDKYLHAALYTNSTMNKAGYTAIQLLTVGQEQ